MNTKMINDLPNPIMKVMYHVPSKSDVFVIHKHPTDGYGIVDDDSITYVPTSSILVNRTYDLTF